jgi:hypothetical protein
MIEEVEESEFISETPESSIDLPFPGHRMGYTQTRDPLRFLALPSGRLRSHVGLEGSFVVTAEIEFRSMIGFLTNNPLFQIKITF